MQEIAIAIDIGGTNTKFGFVDRQGNIYADGVVSTDAFDNVEDYLVALVKTLRESETSIKEKIQITGVGIGAPNANIYKGTIENAPNLKWSGVVHLADLFKRYYDVPVKITNDANAAALGEMLYGGAREMRNFIMITLGTGLGSGIVVNGALVYGHDGFAGEIGHVNLFRNGRQCGCGNFGCLETYVSATGIKRTVFELLAYGNEPSELARFAFNDLHSEMIYEAAKNGDPIALKAFQLTGQYLGEKLADSVAHTSPEAIFLFGGLAKAGDLIFQPTKHHFEKSLLAVYRKKISILPSALINKNAAVLGAGALIWNER